MGLDRERHQSRPQGVGGGHSLQGGTQSREGQGRGPEAGAAGTQMSGSHMACPPSEAESQGEAALTQAAPELGWAWKPNCVCMCACVCACVHACLCASGSASLCYSIWSRLAPRCFFQAGGSTIHNFISGPPGTFCLPSLSLLPRLMKGQFTRHLLGYWQWPQNSPTRWVPIDPHSIDKDHAQEPHKGHVWGFSFESRSV